jgi:hypothetical protein
MLEDLGSEIFELVQLAEERHLRSGTITENPCIYLIKPCAPPPPDINIENLYSNAYKLCRYYLLGNNFFFCGDQ